MWMGYGYGMWIGYGYGVSQNGGYPHMVGFYKRDNPWPSYGKMDDGWGYPPFQESSVSYPSIHNWLVVWNIFYFPILIGNFIIPIDFHIFQRCWNHQPDYKGMAFRALKGPRLTIKTWRRSIPWFFTPGSGKLKIGTSHHILTFWPGVVRVWPFDP